MPSGKGGGAGSHRRGGRARSDDRETTISKNLSYVLRHGAKDLGLGMDEKGFVNVGELLAHNRFRSIKATFPEIQGVVSTNAKQRFELAPRPSAYESQSESNDPQPSVNADPDNDDDGTSLSAPFSRPPNPNNPGNYVIRATQGHSIKGLDTESLLTPILPSDADFPAEVVHGTYPARWKLILESGGLKPMGRTHVHFATGLPGAAAGSSLEAKGRKEEGEEEEGREKDRGKAIEGGGGGGIKATPDAETVVSGMRATASLLVWVDVRRAMEQGGIKWWRSRNGVVLTEGRVAEGQREGLLPLGYVSRVEERRSGRVLWKSDWWDDGVVQ